MVACASPRALSAADRVTLVNGDVLTGTVTARTPVSISLDTALVGRVTIPVSTVRSISSVEDEAHAAASGPWRGAVSADAAVSRGNADTATLNVNVGVARSTRQQTIALFATSLASTVGIGSAEVTTARSNRGGIRMDRDVTGPLYGFGFFDAENDPLQLLDLRTVAGGGLGMHVARGDRGEANLFGGVSYARDAYSAPVTTPTTTTTSTNVTPGNSGSLPPGKGGAIPGRTRTPPSVVNTTLSRSVGEWVVGHDAYAQLSDRVSLTERAALFPALAAPSDYRVSLDATIGAQLNGWLQWNATVADRYLRIPPAGGAVRNDLFVASGFGVTFGAAGGHYTGADSPTGRLRR